MQIVRTITAILAVVVALCGVAVGQQSRSAADLTPAPAARLPGEFAATPLLEESRPPILYLPDKSGNLQALTDFPANDLMPLDRLHDDRQHRIEPPAYSLDRLTAQGTAGPTFAELRVQINLSLHTDRWVRVPLEMKQALLRGPVIYKGAGTQFVQFEEGQGYVCWVRGKPDSEHQLTLTLLVPLEKIVRDTVLTLAMPKAVASEMKIEVPKSPNVILSEGASLVSQVYRPNDITELVIAGLNRDFQLSWRATERQDAAAIESRAAVTVQFDGRTVLSEARLFVRSHQSRLDRFLVRLPPNMQLIPEWSVGYTVTPLGASRSNDDRRVVEVQVRPKMAGPIEVLLRCQREYHAVASTPASELSCFDVVGAIRQSGTITISAPSEWRAVWTTSPEVQQLDWSGNRSLKGETLASFEYYSIPYSLPVRFLPGRAALTVEPEYTLSIDRRQLTLDGRLKCNIGGAKIMQVELELPGWQLDRVGPGELVAPDRLVTDGNRVVIPFAHAITGDVELNFFAHQRQKPGAASFMASLPRVKNANTANATLTVVTASNLEVTPNIGMEGLIRRRSAVPLVGVPQQHEAWHYVCTGNQSVFSADFRVYPQQIAVDVATQVMLGRHAANVEQKFSYSILYDPVDRLTLSVPRMLTGTNRVQILCDGQPLQLGQILDDAGEHDDLAPVTAAVTLPDSRIGACDIIVRYSMPVTERAIGGEVPVDVPLIMPLDGRLAANTAVVRTEGIGEVTPQMDAWIYDELNESSASRNGLRLSSPRRTNLLTVDVDHEEGGLQPTTVIDRAWIATYLVSSHRQDRVVYQLDTDLDDLEITLPGGAQASDVRAWVDGQIVKPRIASSHRIAVPLRHVGTPSRQSRVIELEIPFTYGLTSSQPREFEFAQLTGRAWYRQVYWQVDLPSRDILVGAPGNWCSEFLWGWTGYFWGRQPTLDRNDLETWAGITHLRQPAESGNVYLFSSFGSIEPITIYIASRPVVVLFASGVFLLIALLVIQLPSLRHPAVLLILGVAILATGLIYPTVTLLVAQAASFGMVVALLIAVLKWLFVRRQIRLDWELRESVPTPTAVANGFSLESDSLFSTAMTTDPPRKEVVGG